MVNDHLIPIKVNAVIKIKSDYVTINCEKIVDLSSYLVVILVTQIIIFIHFLLKMDVVKLYNWWIIYQPNFL